VVEIWFMGAVVAWRLLIKSPQCIPYYLNYLKEKKNYVTTV